MRHVMIVDDEHAVTDALTLVLESMDVNVSAFQDTDAALEEIEKQAFDLVLLDLRMPRVNGAQLTALIRDVRPAQRILIVTGYPDDPLVSEALEAGAIDMVKKPFDVGTILSYLEAGERHVGSS